MKAKKCSCTESTWFFSGSAPCKGQSGCWASKVSDNLAGTQQSCMQMANERNEICLNLGKLFQATFLRIVCWFCIMQHCSPVQAVEGDLWLASFGFPPVMILRWIRHGSYVNLSVSKLFTRKSSRRVYTANTKRFMFLFSGRKFKGKAAAL